MAVIQFSNGIKVNFEGNPTSKDIEEITQKLTEQGILSKENAGVRMADTSSLFEKTSKILSSIFGGEKLGEAIGTSIAKLTVPKEQKQFVSPPPLAREVAADIAGMGLTVGGLTGITGSFAMRLLKTAGLGAGLAGAQAVKEGGDAGEVSKAVGVGGAIGAAIPVIGKGLQFIGKQIEQLPSRFVNSALNRSKAQILEDISKDKTGKFIKFVSEKPISSAKQLLDDSVSSINELSGKISSALSVAARKTGAKITIGRDNLLDEIVKLPEAEGALLKRIDVRGIIERLAPQSKQLLQKSSLTLEESNKLRQLVDKTLGDRAFLGTQLSSDKAILKSFANRLRETVKTKAPEGTRELFAELTNEIRFRDGVLNRIAQRAGNQVLSFGDVLGGTAGGIIGGVPGVVGGIALRRGIESVPFKIGAAKVISAVTKAAPIIEQLTPAQQTSILNMFADILSPSDESTMEHTQANE